MTQATTPHTSLTLKMTPKTGRPLRSGSPSFRLQARDLAVVDATHRLRVLTSEHVAALYFPSENGRASSQCRKRLQLLTEAGYLDRREQPQTRTEGRKPYLYFLAPAGRQLLIDEVGLDPEALDWKPSYNDVRWPYLRHQLAINDVYVAFSLAAPRVGWTLATWTDDRFLRKAHTEHVQITGPDGHAQEAAVVPDAHVRFEVTNPLSGETTWIQFFVECDMASEVVAAARLQRNSWQRKIRAYQAYFQSGAILDRYRTKSIRVLTVTTSQARLANLKEATEAEGGRSRYWFATATDLRPETALAAPIWLKAGEDAPVRLTR